MVAAISLDLRKRILKACDAGETAPAVAKRFDVSVAFVHKLKRQLRITGKIEAQPRNSGPKPKLAGYEEKLSALIKAQPDATLEELRARLGVEVELSTLWYFLDRLGLSVKKNSARQRATAQRRAGSARRMERKSTHA